MTGKGPSAARFINSSRIGRLNEILLLTIIYKTNLEPIKKLNLYNNFSMQNNDYQCVLQSEMKSFGIFKFILFYILLHVACIVLPACPAIILAMLFMKCWIISAVLVPGFIAYCIFSYRGEEKTDGRPWISFMNFFVISWFRDYAPMSLYIHKTLHGRPPFQCIVAMHPHGVYADWRLLFDGLIHTHLPFLHNWRVLAAGVLFKFPFVRDIALWSHCVDAGRATAEHNLRLGRTLMLVPGGEAEQLRTARGRDGPLVLRRRTGFVRLALRHGVPVIPAYIFGCSDLYRTSAAALRLREWLVAALRVCVPLAWGAGSPVVPLRAPLRVVLGEPFDPRAFLKPAMASLTALCAARFEEFGTAGQAPRLRPLPLSTMASRYAKGDLDPVIGGSSLKTRAA